MTNFTGPDLVKRLVAAEVFHVWAKRRGETFAAPSGSDSNETAHAKTDPLPAAVFAPTGSPEGAASTAEIDVALCQPPEGSLVAPAQLSAEEAAETEAPAVRETLAVALDGGADGAGVKTPVAPASGLHGEQTTVTPASGANEEQTTVTSASGANGEQTTVTPAGGVNGEQTTVMKPHLRISDSDVISLAGPASSIGGPRVELQMTAGELRKARLSRSTEFKQLLLAMINDPTVQAGQLDVVTQPTCPTPQLTAFNSSGAAAAAAAAATAKSQAAAARAVEDTTRAMALLASGRERARGGPAGGSMVAGLVLASPVQGTRSEQGCTNGDGTIAGLVAPQEQRPPIIEWSEPGAADVAERWRDPPPPLHRAKRARTDTDASREEDGGRQTSEVDVEGGRGAAAAAAGGSDPAWVSRRQGSAAPALGVMASSSKRRRQLWMLAIRENELRHERRKEEARKEYETRQQELLRWMIDEEAGRHNGCDGDAGPPPMVVGSESRNESFAL